MIHRRMQQGFTLIEALVYLALFSILMGGATVGAYYLFESATTVGTRTMVQEESDFLMSKIEWTLSGAQAVTAPGVGVTGSSLTVAKWDTSLGNPMTITKDGTRLVLTRGGNPPAILNNTNTQVVSITFNHKKGTGDGITPEQLETVLTLSAHTPTGNTVTRTATSTVYLRH